MKLPAPTARLAKLHSLILSMGFVILVFGLDVRPRLVQADEGDVQVVRIEEDWELVVQEPDTSTQAPQVTCVISPQGNLEGTYAALTLNHTTLPDFSPGGLQLQLWHGSTAVANGEFPHNDLLASGGETICWTQQMRLEGNRLTFEIVDGTSTTWGNFGGQGYLRVSVDSDLANLNSYSPSVSKNKSGIGYASNRVSSLILKRVRAYSASDLLLEHTDPQVVYQHE